MKRFRHTVIILGALAIVLSLVVYRMSEGIGLLIWFAGASALCGVFSKPGLKWFSIFLVLSMVGALTLQFSSGILLFIHVLLVLLVINSTVRLFCRLKQQETEKLSRYVTNCSLTIGSFLVALGLLEGVLVILDAVLPIPEKPSMASIWRPIPKEWALQTVNVPGAEMAYKWHGIVHYHDVAGMRRTTPILPKEEGVFRILVIGDSYTYGEGVEVDDTYPAILQRELSATYRCEVLNLGIRGLDISGIRKTLVNILYLLEPDLVLYGVCLNDYDIKPFHEDEFNFNGNTGTLWTFLRNRTLTAPFLHALLTQSLMACNLKKDFYEDIATDFGRKQREFCVEAQWLNSAIRDAGCPSTVAMVLEQNSKTKGLSYDLVLTTEENLADVGMDVISAKPYIEKYAGREMIVSAWEKHPNREAHQIFAKQFLEHLRQRKDLEAFRRTIP